MDTDKIFSDEKIKKSQAMKVLRHLTLHIEVGYLRATIHLQGPGLLIAADR